MMELDEIMGALVGSLVNARRIADEETAAVAEYYKENPLLEGITVPRIRVPEMTIDLPVIIESVETGEEGEAEDPEIVAKEIMTETLELSEAENITVPPKFQKEFKTNLLRLLKKGPVPGRPGKKPTREETIRRVELALHLTATRREFKMVFRRDILRKIMAGLRKKAAEVAIKYEIVPPRVLVTVTTNEIKDRAGSGNVARFRLVLKEEGLEWTAIENEDGTTTNKLTPE